MRRTKEELTKSLLTKITITPKTYKEVYRGVCDNSIAMKIIKALAKQKMVKIIQNPKQKNSKLLLLTDKGCKELGIKQIQEQEENICRREIYPEDLTDEELNVLGYAEEEEW
jgi:hypothetical protein